METAGNSAITSCTYSLWAFALPWLGLPATQSSQQFPSSRQKSEQDPHVIRSLSPWCRKHSGNASSKCFVGKSNSDFSWCNWVQILLLSVWGGGALQQAIAAFWKSDLNASDPGHYTNTNTNRNTNDLNASDPGHHVQVADERLAWATWASWVNNVSKHQNISWSVGAEH